MAKTLKDFMKGYRQKSDDLQKEIDKLEVDTHDDRNEVGGKANGDEVFKASNVKTIARGSTRHGYDPGDDEKVYEEVEEVEEAKKTEKQHIEVTSHTGHKKLVPVHPLNAYKALNHYRGLVSTKSARIVSEDVEDLDEKTLTPAEMKKREEVVKAIKRENPKMEKSMAYAIATKTAKRVAEGVIPTADEPSEHDKKMAQKVRDLLAKEKKPVKEEIDDDLEAELKAQRQTKKSVGGKWKSVPYKTADGKWATKDVKEEVEELDESVAKVAAHLIKRYGDNVRKSHVRSAANDFGVGFVALSHHVRKKLGVNRLEEEQIDEAAYEKDLEDHEPRKVQGVYGVKSKSFEKKFKNQAAQDKYFEHPDREGNYEIHYVSKLHEEVEELDEISQMMARAARDKAGEEIAGHRKSIEKEWDRNKPNYGKISDTQQQIMRRQRLSDKVTRKLAKEEAEELDELSKNLLNRYLRKAGMRQWQADENDRYEVDPRVKGTRRPRYSHTNNKSNRIDKMRALARNKINPPAKILATEEAEDLDEAVEVRHDRYLRSHGKKAKGSGSFAFTHKQYGDPSKDEMHWVHHAKSFGDAAKSAKQWAKSKGHSSVYVMEEVEELDELSSNTLTNYIAKASDARGHRKLPTKKVDNRYAGVKKASDILAKEEVEELDELSRATISRYSLKAKSIADNEGGKDRSKGRELAGRKNWGGSMKGVERARVPSTNEEVEELDEISKKTLGSYITKASSERVKIARDMGDGKGDYFKNLEKSSRRMSDIDKAVRRLTKEDIIDRTIQKYAIEENILTPEQRLSDLIEGLSPSHIKTLATIFEGLTADNKLRMLEVLETSNGVNELLNFAIDNRSL